MAHTIIDEYKIFPRRRRWLYYSYQSVHWYMSPPIQRQVKQDLCQFV